MKNNLFSKRESWKSKLFMTFGFLFMLSLTAMSQNPDFSCVGFAAQNGGTTGGQGGQEVTVTTLEQFKQYVSEKDATARIIYVKGTLEGAGGGEIVSIGSNKSIIGIGSEGKVLKVQFYCKNSKNLIIRNLFFSMENSTLGSDADCISIATTGSSTCQNIWIDHCTFDNNMSPVQNASASQKDKYDGLLDIKKNSEYITISWCEFKNHYKGILVGYTASDTYDRKITMHHNSFINIASRTPSYRGGTAHIYNNYWDGCYDSGTGKYFSTAVNTREEACLYVESNYFKNVNKTVYCALEDVTKEGYAFYQNNKFVNSTAETATTCNSFTPPYSVTVDNVDDVPVLVSAYAGVGVIEDPANYPAPEGGGTTPSGLSTPILNQPTAVTATGFDIGWTAVDEATEYTLTVSYDETSENANNEVFKESFNGLTTDVTGNALTSEKTDNPSDKFGNINSGSRMICSENGTMDLNGGRFTINNLDLSASPTLEIRCKYVSGSGKFLVHVDYTGTSGSGAVYNVAASTIGSDYATISIPLTGTAASYIQLRTESSTVIRIDDISISANGAGVVTHTQTYTIAAPATSYSVTGLTEGIEYTVEVAAKSDSQTSASSNAVYVKTQAGLSIDAENNAGEPKVFVLGNNLLINEVGNYSVYNITGCLVAKGIAESVGSIISKSLDKGIYIVIVNNEKVKVIIK